MTLEQQCPACGAAFKSDAAFCASCGRRRAPVEPGLKFAIAFYLALLAIQMAALIAARAGATAFHTVVLATFALMAATLSTAAVHRRLINGAYHRPGFSAAGYALILAAAPFVLAIISGYVDLIGRIPGVSVQSELAGLEDHGLGWILFVIAIAPPLFEELAFRGLMFSALARELRRVEVYVISSFAFALLHLSLPMLLTHLPLGLYLCWLRERSGSLWPPMFAHFCHNLGVIIIALHGAL